MRYTIHIISRKRKILLVEFSGNFRSILPEIDRKYKNWTIHQKPAP